jgi:ABC-type glycerol-3-phosphate transport system substrate-binding protein
LYKFLADEPELKENLLPFVTDSVDINGVLPQMITKFTVNTLIGKTKNLGDGIGWSIGDMLEMYKSLPDDVILSYELSQYLLQNYVLDNIISECVDYINGTCDFNKQGFKDYIELYSLLPEYFDVWQIRDYTQFQKDNYAKCRNDEMLLGAVSSIGNVITYVNEIRLYFRDEEVNIIGFPTMNGDTGGDYINSNGFSILNTSKNKDAAWEFIKFCLSDEFAERSTNLFMMIPTTDAMKIYNDWFRKQYIYYSDNKLDFEYSSSEDFDFEAVYGSGLLEQINDEWIDEFNTYLDTVDHYVYKDRDVANIVNEELSAYVNSNKSIDATINAIQSRVSIYMSEMWG